MKEIKKLKVWKWTGAFEICWNGKQCDCERCNGRSGGQLLQLYHVIMTQECCLHPSIYLFTKPTVSLPLYASPPFTLRLLPVLQNICFLWIFLPFPTFCILFILPCPHLCFVPIFVLYTDILDPLGFYLAAYKKRGFSPLIVICF